MNLLRIVNGQPEKYSFQQLRRDNPGISFPAEPSDDTLAAFDVYRYTVEERPVPGPTERVVRAGFRQVDGAWVEGWAVEDNLDDLRADAELPRFDFAMATAAAGIVTYEVAAQWAAGNQVPPAVQAVIDAMPAEQQGPAVVDVLARPVIRRSGSMMPALAAAYGLTEAQLDALFGIGV